ncbi:MULTISPECIES: GGDEF domain-containing protein [unclassified Exiguobacterium]|uniref:GGDEF domain-containing protein n=1 Tax=unclassified Exiguobacterium TaxID=2644629 RepID=UPI00103FF999|nr:MULTISPECIES: GGDEF domain-containing protein [unclassified Exiguobacterium]TCI39186.1 GGDEF domain-containing protein [Exiguobacterium sp. SH4S7]TCI48129.1 GGDEF domain-containing protein [Exiguobacterium sp. SH5S32]TCI55014.1 GGDEF domain-containing protein [Exiguobacterium sp. SH1S4]TCI63024.1 GGDEF domain-containing protein [Exiguobacterium sp. SH0S2]TCI74808.1 GGDEF domain-containing protein [Exiguobacterium sp. SH1S1]
MSMTNLINNLIANASLLLIGLYMISRLTKLGFTSKLPLRRQITISLLLAGLTIVITLHGVLWNAQADFQYGFVPIIIAGLYFGLQGVRITYVSSILLLPFIISDTLLLIVFLDYTVAATTAVVYMKLRERIKPTRDIRIVNAISLGFIALFSLLNFSTYTAPKMYVYTLIAFVTIGYSTGFVLHIVYGGIRKMQRTERQITKYREAAYTDALTGLGNRRRFEEEMKRVDEEVFSSPYDITLLLLDIDHFKSVNDTYGHDAGDAILIELGKRLTETARTDDMVCRHGGEEFSVLLSDCNLSQGFVIANRYLRQIAESPFLLPDGKQLDITVSIGVASTSEPKIVTSEQLTKKSDLGLYVAKRSGRNRVSKWNQQQAN